MADDLSKAVYGAGSRTKSNRTIWDLYKQFGRQPYQTFGRPEQDELKGMISELEREYYRRFEEEETISPEL